MKKRVFYVLFTLITALMLTCVMSFTALASDVHSDHCFCGDSVTTGGHVCDAATWSPWDGTDEIDTDVAYLYLSEDIVLDAPLTVADSKTLYLCLNGNDLTLSNGTAGSVIVVQGGGTLHICDCKDAGRVIGINARTQETPGGAIYVLSGGSLNLYSGTVTDTIITNEYADRDIYNCGTFNMYGGTVTGSNSANYKKANGTWTKIHSYNAGTTNLYGGKVSGVWGGVVWTFTVTDQAGNGKITFEPLDENITPSERWPNHYYKLNSTDTPSERYQTGELPACVVKACNAYYMPWADSRTKITSVEIKEGVKSIGSFAFDTLTNVGGELVIPKTVEYIGHQAFAKCQFTKINFQVDAITKQSDLHCIAQGAFSSAIIRELVLPEGLDDIHGSAFGSCKSLETIHIPSTVTLMGGWNCHLDYGWSEGSAGYTLFPYCTSVRKITFADEAVRDRFIYYKASDDILSPSTHTQKTHIDAYIGLTAYPRITDAIQDSQSGDTVMLVKSKTGSQKRIEIPLDSEAIIPSGVTIEIPEGQTLYSSGTLVNFGSITGVGSISNTGTYMASESASVSDTLTLTGIDSVIYAYPIYYELDGGLVATANPGYYIIDGAPVFIASPEKAQHNFLYWIAEDGITVSQSGELTIPDNFSGEEIVLRAKYELLHNLWIGGVQFTSENTVIDGNDDPLISGSATLTSVYEDENGDPVYVITLNGFEYEGDGYSYVLSEGTCAAAIYSMHTVNMILVGDNTITHVNSGLADYSFAIYAGKDLTVENSSTGSLSAIGGDALLGGYGMGAFGDTVIYGGRVTAIGNTSAFKGGCEIDGGFNSIVYAGEDERSLAIADASSNDTYANKYVKIVPAYNVTVKFGVDSLTDSLIIIPEGQTISLSFVSVNGYVFYGWYADEDYTEDFDFSQPITEDICVYAKFISVEDLKGEQGDKGENGREIELNVSETHIQWRYVGETEWKDLIALEALKGPSGADGQDGKDGKDGEDGIDGINGADGREVVIKVVGDNLVWFYEGEENDPSKHNIISSLAALKGENGQNGDKGDKGETGSTGADGVGISSIEKTSTEGNVDTYTITLSNGVTYTFTVTNSVNGKDGEDGQDGKDGIDGKDGKDGETPYIGENGNWWIGESDTGVRAVGYNGSDGEDGSDGKNGASTAATAIGGTAIAGNVALLGMLLSKKRRGI